MEKYAIRMYTDELNIRVARGIHERAENEFHNEYELYYLYDGEVTLVSEYGSQSIAPNTLVVIPKEYFHRFVASGDTSRLHRCTCHFDALIGADDIVDSKITGILFASNHIITNQFENIKSLCKMDIADTEKRVLLKAYIYIVLATLKPSQSPPMGTPMQLNNTVRKIISYISKNIDGDLSLNSIADASHISSSYLCYLFKKHMHIPVHKYILNKRLVLANRKIMGGTPPLTAALECGFSDYSNFYVQYKKRFGINPAGK